MATAIALIHRDEGSEYGISFPDFPGCVSGGASLEEAFQRGSDALAAHVEALMECGEALPTVRSFDALKADPALAEDFADAVLVGVVDVDL
ncbi:MAG: type II toxin-antitoxin system HicB family antitoxin [Pigmentiphaga sp.]